MSTDELANLKSELQKANDVLVLKPESEYFQKRKKELEGKIADASHKPARVVTGRREG